MMGNSNQSTTGVEAREAVKRYFNSHTFQGPTGLREQAIQMPVDQFIRWLDGEGFLIVPKKYKSPARRGMIGRSHSAKLAGQ